MLAILSLASTARASSPTVKTGAASSIASTSATLNGTVNPNGSNVVVYFQWGTNNNLLVNLTSGLNESGSSSIPVSIPLSSLSPNTKYYYQIVSYVFGNPSLISYGSDSNFITTSVPKPTVTTTGVTGNGSSVTANGTFNPNGSTTYCYFNWGTSTGYGFTTTPVAEGSGTTTLPFSASLSPITPEITYHYQMVAYNSGGTNYGSDTNFTTVNQTATTGTATPVSPTSETVNGSVNPNGWGITAYFEYGPTTSYGSTEPIPAWTESGSSTVPLAYTLTGLSPNTLYHYKMVTYITAFANITADGADQTFTTESSGPAPTNNFYLLPQCINGFQVDVNGATDPGSTITNLVWNWGDGYQISGGFPNTHTYSSAGQYILQVTAYNSDGSSDFILQTNNVGPGILSGCYAWTISAEQGGSVSYQGSVASGTVSSGGSVTLQQAPEVGGPLTANPSPGYSFSGWSASSDIWFNFGSTNTLSVGAVVDGNGTITASFSALAPIVTTASASSVTANSATLNGSVNPNGLATTAYFQYGTSTNYNNTAPVSSLLNGTSTTGVSVPNVSGLTPNTTYHFRLVASSSAGTAYGADTNFTTSLGGTPLPVISPTYSKLTLAPSSQPADGSSQITVTATLRDVNDSPVTNRTIQFSAAGQATVKIANSTVTTDSNGVATTTITATTPGTSTICLIDPVNVNLIASATATFTQQFVSPNADLQSEIQSLYQGSAQILNGTPLTGNNFTTIAAGEGNLGPVFWNLAEGAGAQTIVGAIFYAATSLIGGDGQIIVDSAEQTVKNILGSFLQNEGYSISQLGIDSLINTSVQENKSSSSGILVTRGQNVANICNSIQLALYNQEQSILVGVPPTANSVSNAIVNDLQSRLEANQVLQKYQSQEYAYFTAVANAASAPESQGGLPTTLLETTTIAGGSTLLSAVEQAEETPDVGVDAFQFIQEEWNDYNNENNYLDENYAVGNAIWSVSSSAWAISNNVNSAFQEIAQCTGTPASQITGAILNPSIKPVGNGVTTISSSGTVPGSWSGDDTVTSVTVPATYDVVSDMQITNTGTSGASYMVFAFFSCNVSGLNSIGPVQQVIAFQEYINAGTSVDVPIDYFGNNNGGDPFTISPVNIWVLGYNSSGIFYVDSTTLTVGSSSSSAKVKPLDNPSDSSTNVFPIGNPIRCYVNQNPSNQTYQAQIWVENPFFIPLTATVTQAIPDGATVSDLSTNGTLQGSSIVWTNCIAPSNSVENSFTFSLSVTPGVQTNLPPPTVVFSDTNANSLSLQGIASSFSGLFPIQVSSSIPAGVLGVDSTMLVAVTNLTGTSQSGSLTVTLTDSSGNPVTNFLESFSLDGSDGTNLSFTLPGSLSAGAYSLTGSLSINGGTGQVLAGNYVVPAPPVALNLGSTPALTTNGLNVALQGPAGNYLIEASSDLSSPTNWQPIMFYSSTNASFFYNFSIPMATNVNQQFYRAVMQ